MGQNNPIQRERRAGHTQANQRLPKALSNGFSHARGEFWTWTSADNIMEPRMLEMLVGKLRAEPATGLTYADYYAIDDRGALLQDREWRAHNRPNPASGEIRLPRSAEALNKVQDNFIGPCFMYRGWIGRCLGDYDPQLGVEDYDYWMRVNAFFPVRHLGNDSLLYRYRVHDNTLSAKAHEHRILEKVRKLMDYEKQRAAYYAAPLALAADDTGAGWLRANGVAPGAIQAFGATPGRDALIVIDSATAMDNLDLLLRPQQPVAVILRKEDVSHHKLHRLLASNRCLAMAQDRIGAARVRLVSTCPVLDVASGAAYAAARAFAKNLLFISRTRSAEEMQRVAPRSIVAPHGRHVLLQVDSFTQGGMENVVIDLALSLQASGYRVTIGNLGKSGDAVAKARERGLPVECFAANLAEDAYLEWLHEHQVRLVNAHYSIYGALTCHRAGIAFVQTIHNSYVWFDTELIRKYREADANTIAYLCVSNTAAGYADVVLGLDVGKMRVVPNGIDPDAIDATHFAANRASLRKQWGVGAQAPVFLNVASIMATKAQLPLVRAFAKVVESLPEAQLVLLGAVMEAPYHKAIEKTVRDLRLQDKVVFAGYDRDVARYYHAADIFILPSYWEGWSLSLGEAMANGLACVITDVGSAYEFEDCDNVEIVAPPFGDITALNHRNLGTFVYGEDAAFEQRLAAAMRKAAARPRGPIDMALAQRLDRSLAYQTYSTIFSKI